MTYGEIFVHPSAWLITFFFTAILTPGKNIDRMKALLIVHLHPFLSLSSRPHLFSSPSSSLPSPTLFSPTPTLFSPPLLLSLTTLSYSLLTTSATLFSPPSPTLFSPLLLLSSHHLSYSHTPPSPTLFSPPLLLFSHHPLLLSSHHFSYSLLTTSPTLFSPFPPPFLSPFLLLHFLPSHLLLLFFTTFSLLGWGIKLGSLAILIDLFTVTVQYATIVTAIYVSCYAIGRLLGTYSMHTLYVLCYVQYVMYMTHVPH
jgi:hypothetical protein